MNLCPLTNCFLCHGQTKYENYVRTTDAECQLTPKGSMLLTGGTQKALSTKEMTQCSEWPEILCSNGNFLVLADKCIPFHQKGVWAKSRSGSWPVAALQMIFVISQLEKPTMFGRRFLKLS